MLKVLQHILMSRPAEQPEYIAYSDAVKELQADSMYELQRLATKMPDQLLVGSRLLYFTRNINTSRRTFIRNLKKRLTRSYPQALLN